MVDSSWPDAQFVQLAGIEELVLVVSRTGHDTLRVPVWVVAVDGAVYVRSYKGVTSGWFRRVQTDVDQAIRLGTADVPVRFENVDRLEHVNRAIDAEYDRKYAQFDYVSAMSEPAAVEATLRVIPR
jgi:hypothetical protein